MPRMLKWAALALTAILLATTAAFILARPATHAAQAAPSLYVSHSSLYAPDGTCPQPPADKRNLSDAQLAYLGLPARPAPIFLHGKVSQAATAAAQAQWAKEMSPTSTAYRVRLCKPQAGLGVYHPTAAELSHKQTHTHLPASLPQTNGQQLDVVGETGALFALGSFENLESVQGILRPGCLGVSIQYHGEGIEYQARLGPLNDTVTGWAGPTARQNDYVGNKFAYFADYQGPGDLFPTDVFGYQCSTDTLSYFVSNNGVFKMHVGDLNTGVYFTATHAVITTYTTGFLGLSNWYNDPPAKFMPITITSQLLQTFNSSGRIVGHGLDEPYWNEIWTDPDGMIQNIDTPQYWTTMAPYFSTYTDWLLACCY